MKITNAHLPFPLHHVSMRAAIRVEDTCPKCGELVEIDYWDEAMSYPFANHPYELEMKHYGCPKTSDDEFGAEWTVNVVLRVTLEAAP